MAEYSLQKQVFRLSLFFMLILSVLFPVFNISTSIRKVEENYRSSLISEMKKIGSVMEMVYEDVDQVSLFVLVDPKINHFLEERFRGEAIYGTSIKMGTVYNSLNYLSNTNKYVRSIQIEGINGQGPSNGLSPKNTTARNWERVEKLQERALQDVDEGVVTVSVRKEWYICQSCLLRDYENTTRTAGIIRIYLNTDALQELFTNGKINYTNYFIVDDSSKVQYVSIRLNGPAILEEPISYGQLYAHRNGAPIVQQGNPKLCAAPRVIHEDGWMMYSLSIPADTQTQTRDSPIQLLVPAALCFLLYIIIMSIISRRMCRPLEEIIDNMRSLEREQSSMRVKVRGNNETSLPARQFNRVAQKIQSLIEEVYLVNI